MLGKRKRDSFEPNDEPEPLSEIEKDKLFCLKLVYDTIEKRIGPLSLSLSLNPFWLMDDIHKVIERIRKGEYQSINHFGNDFLAIFKNAFMAAAARQGQGSSEFRAAYSLALSLVSDYKIAVEQRLMKQSTPPSQSLTPSHISAQEEEDLTEEEEEVMERGEVVEEFGDFSKLTESDSLKLLTPYLTYHELRHLAQTNRMIREEVVGSVKYYLSEQASKYFYNDKKNVRNVFADKYVALIFSRSKIKDLASLPPVAEILLEECHKIQDVSHLSNLKFVSIIKCRGVRNVSCLANVNELVIHQADYLEEENEISGFSSLGKGNIKDLTLIDCSKLSDDDIKEFTLIPKLKLEYCLSLTSVSCLANNQTLELIQLDNVKDIDSLVNVKNLSMELSGYSVLDFYHNKNNFRTKMKDKVKAIQIGMYEKGDPLQKTFDKEIKSFDCFRGIHTVLVYNCSKLPLDLSGISEAKRVDLDGCGVADVSALITVPLLTIYKTTKVTKWYNAYS